MWLHKVEIKTFSRTLTLTNLEKNMINVFFNANRLERVYSGGNLQSEFKSEQNIFFKLIGYDHKRQETIAKVAQGWGKTLITFDSVVGFE